LNSYISRGSVATQLSCGNIISNYLLQVFHRMCWWKIFENRSVFGKNMDKSLRLTFWTTLYMA